MIRETAITAFAIVGLMYIFQEHSIEIKHNEELIKRGRIQQSILESNLTLLTEKEKKLNSKNIKLLSDIETINSEHKAKIEDFNKVFNIKKTDITVMIQIHQEASSFAVSYNAQSFSYFL